MVIGISNAIRITVVVFCGYYFVIAVVFSFVAVVVAGFIGVAFFHAQAVVRVSVLYDHSAHVVVSSGRVGAAAAQGVVDFHGVACRTVDAFQVVDRTVHAVSYFYLPATAFFDYVGVAVVVHVYPSDLAVIDGVVYAGVRVEDGLEDPQAEAYAERAVDTACEADTFFYFLIAAEKYGGCVAAALVVLYVQVIAVDMEYVG